MTPAPTVGWRDMAVELADQFDTPDFRTNPDGNSSTIEHVWSIIKRNLMEKYPVQYKRRNSRSYWVTFGGETVGYVVKTGSGGGTFWGWGWGGMDRDNDYDHFGAETRLHATSILVDRTCGVRRPR